MSIALERSNNTSTTTTTSNSNNNYSLLDHDDQGIGRSGFSGKKIAGFSSYGNGNNISGGGVGVGRKVVEEDGSEDSSSSTSSIGRNSDEESSEAGPGGGDGDGEEVQSDNRGGALDSLEALEEVLPIKRSISHFYCGKSKSFTSLSDAASCTSLKDIVKPENAYTRKRKNLLAFNNFFDKNLNGIQRSNSGGLSKRATSSRSSLALAASMGYTESTNNSDSSNSNSPSPGICLPPLPPQSRRTLYNDSSSPPEQKFSPWRSFSLSDLQDLSQIPR
ncbi:hypothetical protein ACH5RR_006215 [Cinchona calisaya]|uniref:MTD1 n=1 Tax=Cinchona calisaya TaxID=153742 RepID=A0ABD3ANE9_9GENT